MKTSFETWQPTWQSASKEKIPTHLKVGWLMPIFTLTVVLDFKIENTMIEILGNCSTYSNKGIA